MLEFASFIASICSNKWVMSAGGADFFEMEPTKAGDVLRSIAGVLLALIKNLVTAESLVIFPFLIFF